MRASGGHIEDAKLVGECGVALALGGCGCQCLVLDLDYATKVGCIRLRFPFPSRVLN